MQDHVLVVLPDVGVREAAGGAEPADRAVDQLEQAVRGDPGVDGRIEVAFRDALLEALLRTPAAKAVERLPPRTKCSSRLHSLACHGGLTACCT